MSQTPDTIRRIEAQQSHYIEMKFLDLEPCPQGNYDFLPYGEEIAGMTYYIPNDDGEFIVVMDHASKQALETDYYDMDDFAYQGSDYIYVLHNGVLMQKFVADRGE